MLDFHWVPCGDDRLATSVHLPPDAPQPLPTVLVVHGLTGHRIGRAYHLVDLGRRLAHAGIACVRYDQTGCGESTGRFEDLSVPIMVENLRSVRRWAGGQTWCDPARVAIVALSLGGLAAVAVDADEPTRGLALWAPVYSLPEVFADTTRTGMTALLDHQGWVPYRGLRLGRAFIDGLAAVDTDAALARSDSPILTIHSDVDPVVPPAQSDRYLARCREIGRPCERIALAGASHDLADDVKHRKSLMDMTLKSVIYALAPSSV